MTIWQRWKQTALHNKAMVLSSVLMAFGTLFYTGAAIVQIYMFQQSTKQASDQADKLIAAASQIKTAAWQFKGSAQGIDGNVGNAVGKLQGQVDQIKRSATAAENSVQATRDQIRLDQRAWVGSGDTAFTIAVGTPIKVVLTLKNVGKTPAVDLHTRFDVSVAPKDHELEEQDIVYKDTDEIISGTLFPGASVPVETHTLQNADANFIDPLKSGAQTLYAYGTIFYRDVFDHQHWSHFCYWLNADLVHGSTCKIYNDTNDKRPDKNLKQKQ